jgi:MFS superfamily sulfate permease-like transporter
VHQVAHLVSCTLVLVVLYGVGPLLHELPKSVLAGVILVNLSPFFAQITDVRVLYRTSLVECVMWLVTFTSTVVIDVPIGLLCGVGYALATVILRSQRYTHTHTHIAQELGPRSRLQCVL